MVVDEASAADSLAMEPQQSPAEDAATKESSSSSVAFARTPNEESITTKESSAANTADEIQPTGADVGPKESSSVSAILQTTKESSAAAAVETLTKEEVSVASKESSAAAADEAPDTMKDNGAAKELHAAAVNGTLPSSISACGDSSNENEGDSSVPDEGSSGKALEYADELMEKGMKAKKADEFVEAIDCFSRALEIRSDYTPCLLVLSQVRL
ncbi:hypothetical protein ACLOJK_041168 [Asimina triloba]